MGTTTSLDTVRIPLEGAHLVGDLGVPRTASALIVFAHGSGSSRHSTRNLWVADQLRRHGLATLLLDLLTADEDRRDQITRELRFDIPLLARRLTGATEWVAQNEQTCDMTVGFFGASTGAAAALIAAARMPERVGAVVSRGGRPDLARRDLGAVRAPTLLIVGGRDEVVLGMNEEAKALMMCPVELAVVPGATHLFEEPGALDRVAALAADWFCAHLGCAHDEVGP